MKWESEKLCCAHVHCTHAFARAMGTLRVLSNVYIMASDADVVAMMQLAA